MYVWQAILGFVFGLVILFYASQKTVKQLIKLGSVIGVSSFAVGFIIASIGTDMPELMNSVLSAYLGHGDISVGDSFGSVLTQISLVVGLIPFFCTFCRVIPRKFFVVGLTEVIVLAVSVFISSKGNVSRFDGLLLIVLWGISMLSLRKLTKGQKVAVEPSEKREVKESTLKLLSFVAIGFTLIGISSYAVIESTITISRSVGISEYIISFFLIAIGTSLPELVVEIIAIRQGYYELALGDIIGSCIVDATLGIGLGPFFFPITVSGRQILITGLYATLVSIATVSMLSIRGRNDKKSGGILLILYLLSYLTLYIL